MKKDNVILIGMPGCGKSTVSSLIADATGRGLIDTDALIVEAEGRSIPDIFANDGEDYFRACEHKAAEEAGKLSGKIISTGGGAVTVKDNYEPLHQNGIIIFIRRDTDRLSRDGRPLSIGADLDKMYSTRLPMYEGFADITVNNNGEIDTCVEQIITLFRGRK